MKRFGTTLALVALCSSLVDADVTVMSTMSIEGGNPGMAGGAGMTPKLVMRIKGLKARSDVDVNGQTQTSITDLGSKEIIVLQHGQKTAQIYNAQALATGSKPAEGIKLDASAKPTGKSRAIGGVSCDEYALRMAMKMADFAGGASMPPQAAEMMKDVRMVITGSVWVAKSGPGVADFAAFQKAAAAANMTAAFAGAVPGMQQGGVDQIMKTLASMPGLPYLTELQMAVEGTGPMVDAMKQMGGMKIKNAVTEVSTAAIPDDQFQVPAGYTTVKP